MQLPLDRQLVKPQVDDVDDGGAAWCGASD
jgi:hypothetical protein